MLVKAPQDSIEVLVLHAEKSFLSPGVILTWAELGVEYAFFAGSRLLTYGKKGLHLGVRSPVTAKA
jgi:hypothetical protein